MPCGIFTLVHMSSYKIIQTFESNAPNYFKIIIMIIGTSGNTSFAFDCDQNSRILFACDNLDTMESKYDFIFVKFFFHPIPFVICN